MAEAQYEEQPQTELEKFCAAFGSYLDFPELVNNQAEALEKTILMHLTRGDELMTVAQSLENDLSLLNEDIIPTLKKRAIRLQQCFVFIDTMLEFVASQRQTLRILEVQVEEAEEKYKSVSMLKVLSALSIVDKEKLEERYETARTMPLNITNTQEYFVQLKRDLDSLKVPSEI